jgi:hypothetical protein
MIEKFTLIWRSFQTAETLWFSVEVHLGSVDCYLVVFCPAGFSELSDFKNEEYISATAKTMEDAQKLVEAGFEYVTEICGVKLFRKRK